MILVRFDGKEWRRVGSEPFDVTIMVATKQDHYADGRIEEVACDPYPISVALNMRNVLLAIESGAWGAEDLSRYGLALADKFQAPEGYRAIGEEFFVEISGVVQQVFAVEELPPPAPEVVLSIEERVRRMFTVASSTSAPGARLGYDEFVEWVKSIK